MGFIDGATIDRHRLSPIDKLKPHEAPAPFYEFAVGAGILAVQSSLEIKLMR